MRPSIYIVESDSDRTSTLESLLESLGYGTRVAGRNNQLDGVEESCAAWIGSIASGTQVERHLSLFGARASQLPLIVAADSPAANRIGDERRCHRVNYPLDATEIDSLLQRLLGLQGPNGERRLVGSSEAMQRVHALVRKVARYDTNVLILGASGSGKEMVARTIHDCSPRRDQPFVAINCGAIPADLLESELFGHEKGAFTGAISTRKGRFELAENGTLFLDEIGDMSLPMQVKLLRVLQERVYERVGGNRSMPCNVRIVAATHRDLEAAIQPGGGFRADLYYRLNVFPIEMPGLRERIADLPDLIAEFTQRLRRAGHETAVLNNDAIRALARHSWPGNVRELGNLIERLSVLYPGRRLRISDLPLRYRENALADADMPAAGEFTGDAMDPFNLPTQTAFEMNATSLPQDGIDLKDHLAEIEVALIRQALALAGGVVAQAAKILRVQRTTLVEKLRKYGLQTVLASAPE